MAGQGENSLINAVVSFNYFFQLCLCFPCSFRELHVDTRTQPLAQPLLFARGRRRSGDKATEAGELRLRSEQAKNKIFSCKGE